VTTKVFDQKIDTIIAESEIEAVSKASPLSFTPTLIGAKPGGHWYSETFIPGERSSRTEQSVPDLIFNQVIVHHICEMLLAYPVHTFGLQEYISSLKASFDQQMMHLEMLPELSTEVHTFTREIITKLEAADSVPVQLGFTHGDFSFVNFIFHHKKKIAVIDWESAQHRSILHDLYNYFLTELYYGRAQGDLVKEIDESISLIARELLRSNTSIEAETLEKSRDTYRWFYYIERMQVLLDREPSEIQKNVIRHSIETFSQHEASTSSKHGNPQPLFARP
jgi:aminoglycoside phosphotransferase (APT) family kinase protein